MFDNLFKGLFDTELTTVISVTDFLLCQGVALIIGIAFALSYSYRTRFTKSFAVTLSLLPAVVCVVIMMVNGNVGTGVAVAGAFSLVRFRSVPGTAKEIVALFLAMGSGLIAGMGYLGFALLFTAIMCAILVVCNRFSIGERSSIASYKTVRITIPEDLDYTDVFEDIFEKYTSYHELIRVKTVNMGSMFRLSYDVKLNQGINEKDFIDELRVRNGNLEISIAVAGNGEAQL